MSALAKWLTTLRKVFINYSILNTSWLSYTDCVLSRLESFLHSSGSRLEVAVILSSVGVGAFGWSRESKLSCLSQSRVVSDGLLWCLPLVGFFVCFVYGLSCDARDHLSLLTKLVSLVLLSNFNLLLLICCSLGLRLPISLELTRFWADSSVSKLSVSYCAEPGLSRVGLLDHWSELRCLLWWSKACKGLRSGTGRVSCLRMLLSLLLFSQDGAGNSPFFSDTLYLSCWDLVCL